MKKFTKGMFLGMLTLTMLLSMTACGGKKTEEEDKKEATQTESQKDDETEVTQTEETQTEETQTEETQTEETQTEETQTESTTTDAPAPSKDGGVDNAVEKYGLNMEATERIPMAAEKPYSLGDLGKIYEEKLASVERGSLTYDEVVALIGAEPNEFDPAYDAPALTFRWSSSENDVHQVRAIFEKDDSGVWKIVVFGSNF